MARTPDPKLQSRWRDRVLRQEASGLTIVKFCAQEGIARSKFNAWKRRFRLMEVTGSAPDIAHLVGFSSCEGTPPRSSSPSFAADRGRPAQWSPPAHSHCQMRDWLADSSALSRGQGHFGGTR